MHKKDDSMSLKSLTSLNITMFGKQRWRITMRGKVHVKYVKTRTLKSVRNKEERLQNGVKYNRTLDVAWNHTYIKEHNCNWLDETQRERRVFVIDCTNDPDRSSCTLVRWTHMRYFVLPWVAMIIGCWAIMYLIDDIGWCPI